MNQYLSSGEVFLLSAKLHGLDQTEAIIWAGSGSPRHSMVYNIDEGGLVGVTAKQKLHHFDGHDPKRVG